MNKEKQDISCSGNISCTRNKEQVMTTEKKVGWVILGVAAMIIFFRAVC